MTPETQGFQLLWGLSWSLAETPTLSRGSPRAGPRSPRGAGPHCTVTACLVLTRQVNSIPPLLSPFFPPFLPFVFCPPLSLSLPSPPLSPSSCSSVSIFPSTIFFPHVFRVPSFDLVVSIATAATSFSDFEWSPTVSLWYTRIYIV